MAEVRKQSQDYRAHYIVAHFSKNLIFERFKVSRHRKNRGHWVKIKESISIISDSVSSNLFISTLTSE